MVEIIRSTAAFLLGIGTLLIGTSALIKVYLEWKKNIKLKGGKMKTKKGRKFLSFLPWIVLILISISIFVAQAVIGQEMSLNEELTYKSWTAFNKEEFQKAIEFADQCIDEFKGGAKRMQKRLEDEDTSLPPVGKVSESVKNEILSRGLLNDVATCYFIKGRSLEKLSNIESAIAAHQEAAILTYARCWDPKGWFWSVSEAAKDRLDGLK